MRRILLFLFSAGLFLAGLYVFLTCLAHFTVYTFIRCVISSAFWMGLGAFMLWDDFIKPAMHKAKAKSGGGT